MTARRFELSEGSSDKFWEIEQDGSDVTTRWGRRGTSGQSKTKSYASVAAATADLRKQIEAKTSKGYREVVDNDDDADDAPLVKRVPAPADDDEPETDDAADAPAALNDLDDGESTTVAGSGSNTYTLNNTAGVYSCSCPAWRHQSIPIEQRTCKHLRKFRGDAAEEHRVGTLPSRAIKPRKAKASSAGSGDNTDGDDDASAGGLDLL
ncbi:MAG: WGR domain-containing protein, partial [Planctomycetota bacterium]